MAEDNAILVIVSSLINEDLEFRRIWGVADKEIGFFDENGNEGTEGKSVVLIKGHPTSTNEVAKLVLALIGAESGAAVDSTWLFLHTGGGRNVRGDPGSGLWRVNSLNVKEGEQWKGLFDRAREWTWEGADEPRRLGNYLSNLGHNRGAGAFTKGIEELRRKLASLSIGAGAGNGEDLTRLLVEALDGGEHKSWLDDRRPPSPWAIVMHDTMNLIDAIRIELDTCQREASYLKEVCDRYAGRALLALDQLKLALGLQTREVALPESTTWLKRRNLDWLPEWVSEARESGDTASKKVLKKLEKHLGDARIPPILTALNGGSSERVQEQLKSSDDEQPASPTAEASRAEDGVETLKAWSKEVRSLLSVLQHEAAAPDVRGDAASKESGP